MSDDPSAVEVPHVHETPDDGHGNAYDGLLVADSSQWAFGTGLAIGQSEDPLAGIDTAVPDGVDPELLATYCLMLGDDALVASHRLSEWCGRAPDLEEDIALANVALDLLGQARLLLARAATAAPHLVRRLAPGWADGSPAPPEDALAFFRGAQHFRNVRLAEVAGGDFAHTTVRLLLLSLVRLAVLERLEDSRDHVLSAVAAKGVKELAYHRDHAARWVVVLARGTDESRQRLVAALAELWPLYPETLGRHPVEEQASEAGIGVVPAEVAAPVDAVLDQVLAAAGVDRPEASPMASVNGATGRDGTGHTEALSRMLAEMQSVAREHPVGRW